MPVSPQTTRRHRQCKSATLRPLLVPMPHMSRLGVRAPAPVVVLSRPCWSYANPEEDPMRNRIFFCSLASAEMQPQLDGHCGLSCVILLRLPGKALIAVRS